MATLNNVEKIIRQMSNENTAKTFAFNSSEAAKERTWSTQMSNTSHQREVADLRAAGLNPVLSANGGASAYSAASASGSADNTAASMVASLYLNKMNNDNAVKIAKIQQNTEKLKNKNATKIAKIQAAASKYASDNAASATRYASDTSSAASRYSSNRSYDASIYGTDKSKYGMIDNFMSSLFGDNNSGQTYEGKVKTGASNASEAVKRGLKRKQKYSLTGRIINYVYKRSGKK